MKTFLGYIPNSSSIVSLFQSPEKKGKSVDHTVVRSKSNTDSMFQLTEQKVRFKRPQTNLRYSRGKIKEEVAEQPDHFIW